MMDDGRGTMEEGRRKREEGRGTMEEGRWKRDDGRGKNMFESVTFSDFAYNNSRES